MFLAYFLMFESLSLFCPVPCLLSLFIVTATSFQSKKESHTDFNDKSVKNNDRIFIFITTRIPEVLGRF